MENVKMVVSISFNKIDLAKENLCISYHKEDLVINLVFSNLFNCAFPGLLFVFKH